MPLSQTSQCPINYKNYITIHVDRAMEINLEIWNDILEVDKHQCTDELSIYMSSYSNFLKNIHPSNKVYQLH